MKTYNKPEITVVKFATEDIVRTSNPVTDWGTSPYGVNDWT